MQQRRTKWTAYYASNNIWQFNFHAVLSSANQHWSPQHFGCSGTSGTFVMAFFFLYRARAGTNRTDPPLSVRNRWMGESGQACPASHYHFLNKSFFSPFFFYLKGLIAETGTEGERHTPALMSAFECFLPAKSIFPSPVGLFWSVN